MRLYETYLARRQLHADDKYLWEKDVKRLGESGKLEASKVFDALDEEKRHIIPRCLLQKTINPNDEPALRKAFRSVSEDRNDSFVGFADFVQFYYALLNSKPSAKIEIDFHTASRGSLAYYATYLDAYERSPQDAPSMREAQQDVSVSARFERGEFKNERHDESALASLLARDPARELRMRADMEAALRAVSNENLA